MTAAETRPTEPAVPEHSATLTTALDVTPVIAILRARSAGRFGDVADVLTAAGVRAIEFTLTTPGVLDALREYAATVPDGVALGAGSVTTPAGAQRAVAAGATYLLAPATCSDVVAEAGRLDVPVIPGAFTPTEVLAAWRAGATMVKLFPASVGGPEYLRALRAPLPDVPLVPTGGIGLDEAPAYLAAGATALGMGGPLLGDACEGGDLDALRERAAGLVAGLRR